MRVDARIQDAWSSVPSFLKIKPLRESVNDPPMLVIQRFGLASLYQKARCGKSTPGAGLCIKRSVFGDASDSFQAGGVLAWKPPGMFWKKPPG